jgi:DNA-binding response OmpR family regulator
MHRENIGLGESAPSTAKKRVLVIDDELHVREAIEDTLTLAGFDVLSAADGASGLKAVEEWQPECILLDIIMPQLDGLTLLPSVRRRTESPIVMLTARGDVHDRIEGLDAGADAFMTKPFDVAELVSRINAALRRPELAKGNQLEIADLTVDLTARTVRRAGAEIELSTREFDLLTVLLRRPKRVFTHAELLDLVWGAERNVLVGCVATYISYLRAKIDDTAVVKLIQTIRGVGYTLRER